MLRSLRLLSSASSLSTQSTLRPVFVNPVEIQQRLDKLPYFVERTKVGRSLPVYTDVSHNGLKITTIVRRIYGDIARLRQALAQVVPARATITVREDLQQIHIKGNQATLVRKFLTEQGF